MSDLVGNPEDRFSQNEAHMKVGSNGVYISRACYPNVISKLLFVSQCKTSRLYFMEYRELMQI